MKTIAPAILLLFVFLNAEAQNKYWVSFRDKAGVTFDPYSYFDERTIVERTEHGISINDSTDYPVNPGYLKCVSENVDALSWSSRWLNGVAVFADNEKIKTVSSLPFVSGVEQLSSELRPAFFSDNNSSSLSAEDSALLLFQTQRMKGDVFVRNNLNGNGIRIAVFDAGFPGVNTNPVFAHLINGKKIIATYDFSRKKEDVYKGHWHGTATLSCIAGITDSINMGLATGAEFLLARTEKAYSERLSEEENWLAAAEWADKNGANIISSSLGYTYNRYFNYQMNGHTSLVSRAATIAASKGILVINAAGNEGNGRWHTIDTPGDADSVLTVGGTDPYNDSHIYFSSFGPSSDGRLKPNVSALGQAIIAKSTGLSEQYGTSFSTPLVAGFAACAWQSHRQWSNMELFDAIEKSAHLYPYFDYAHGFGIPQASWFVTEHQQPETTFDFVIINNDIKVILRDKYSFAETEAELGYNSQRNFYYKIEDKNGFIKKYFVLIAFKKEMLHFLAEEFQTGDVLSVHFEGYTSSLDFPGELK